MAASDLPAVAALAEAIHTDFPEDLAVFGDKLAHFPNGCFVLAGSGGQINGYCFSHPWRLGRPPALNQTLGGLPTLPETFFIHDLAIVPGLRGTGAAGRLVPRLLSIARRSGIGHASLVAVHGSAPFWQRMGFAVSPDQVAQSYAHAAYAPDAVYMVRPISRVPETGT